LLLSFRLLQPSGDTLAVAARSGVAGQTLALPPRVLVETPVPPVLGKETLAGYSPAFVSLSTKHLALGILAFRRIAFQCDSGMLNPG